MWDQAGPLCPEAPETVAESLRDAVEAGRGLSLVRLGDGEALTLAHGVTIGAEEARRRGPFLPYAGVFLPDPRGRNRLADAVRGASIIGVSFARGPNYGPLLLPSLRAHGIDLTGRRITKANINYTLHGEGHLARLLLTRPKPSVLVVGNLALPLGAVLRDQGVDVRGSVHPVDGLKAVDSVLERAYAFDAQVALIAAGIAAVPLAVELASLHPVVALDFGHLADGLVQGRAPLMPRGPEHFLDPWGA